MASAQATTGICDRTLKIQVAIVESLNTAGRNSAGVNNGLSGDIADECQNVTASLLQTVTILRPAQRPGLTSLKSGDFAGLTGLTTLDLQNHEISELPADIFDGLDAVTDLRFSNNDIEDLPAGVFSGLPAVQILVGSGNRLTHFKADWFDGFQGFQSGNTRLEFVGNRITTIDADTLEGMAGLQRFYFSYNKIRSLPSGLFKGVAAMRFVSLHFNDLETLPAGLFDRLTADGTVGSNTTLTRVNVSDNNLRSLPSGIFDNLAGLQQVRLHNNSLTSLPSGIFDNNAGLYEVWLSHNQLRSLPRGLFNNNPSLFYLHMNDNRIASLDGVGLDNKAGLLNFHLHNNALTQFPDAFVTSFVDDTNEASPNNCMLRFTFDNNPLSEVWIQSGKLSDVLTAFGRRTGGCEALGAQASLKYAYRLGVGGIDLDVEVTGRDKTAWQLLLDDFAATDRYQVIFDFSFGWSGLEVDSTVIDALPTTLEVLKIQDARFDSTVTGASFAGFTKTTSSIAQYFFRRPNDPILSIDFIPTTDLPSLPGLQVLTLDNVGLAGDGSRILTGLPVSTMRILAVTNNPRFNQIPAGVKSLTNLIGLDLKSNGIDSLDANGLEGLSDLLFLSVEDNDIATVHEDSFNGLSALRTLLMDDNEIAMLPGDLFSGLSALRDLHLTDNELLGLPSGLFSGVTTLRSIGLQSNPGAPFQIGVSVVDDTTDPTMKQLHIREGAPYVATTPGPHSFTPKIVKDGTVLSVVPVEAGTTMTTQAFTIPEGARVVLPDVLPDRPSSTWEFCLGLDECFSGFEFVLNPKPSIVSMRFDNQNQMFTAGDKLRFKVQFDRDVAVTGKPQFSFMLGDETRYAVYVETTSDGMLCFEYTLVETDRSPDRVSLATSMLSYPSGSSIKDPDTQTVAAATPRRTQATSEALSTPFRITFNIARALISRIESTIRSVNVSGGDSVRLRVDIYGAQDIKDDKLAEGIGFLWSDGDAGGSFEGNGREVVYTAPSVPGTYLITVAAPFSACRAPATDEIRCEDTFEIRVRRPSVAIEPTPEPRNPEGEIPTILVDSDGGQYEVFTPESGGAFAGDASSLEAGPGVVPNGEIIGLRISESGSASNEGKIHQRYTLGGNWYAISAVDASGESTSSYRLNGGVEVCVPLPVELSTNISDLALVAINTDDSLTVLSSRVRISATATNVCGNISSVPANVAVGSAGSPAPLPTAVPEPTPETPDTGGVAPSSTTALILTMLFGLVGLVVGVAVIRSRRRGQMK